MIWVSYVQRFQSTVCKHDDIVDFFPFFHQVSCLFLQIFKSIAFVKTEKKKTVKFFLRYLFDSKQRSSHPRILVNSEEKLKYF